jgi:hypothetical protein
MRKLALIAALLLAVPVAAQSPQQPLGAGGQTNTSQIPNTGVICTEAMLGTFCNVPTSPNTNGYGSGLSGASRSSSTSGLSSAPGSSGYGSSSAGAGSNTPSIPLCSTFPPPNELCY